MSFTGKEQSVLHAVYVKKERKKKEKKLTCQVDHCSFIIKTLTNLTTLAKDKFAFTTNFEEEMNTEVVFLGLLESILCYCH